MIAICDVGPRDGLQNESRVLAPATRIELIERLSATGLPRIEVASFVDPVRVPQMAGAEEVVAALDHDGAVSYSGLVLNERGYERLTSTRLRAAHVTFGASESFNRSNSNRPVADSAAEAVRIVERARGDGIRISVAIATAFGCPFEGPVDPAVVLDLAERMVAAGVDEIFLADTIGVAVPRQVRELVSRVRELERPVGLHLHNTRSTGYANAYAGVEAGASVLDASVGGIGGCPFAPRASGNIASEDLAYMLQGEGLETGVDLDALVDVAEWLAGVLGRQLEGQLYRAGAYPPVGV